MKLFLKLKKYTLLVAVVFFSTAIMTSCDDDEVAAPTKTILELVQEDEDLSILEGVLTDGIEAALSANGEATLFAPSNDAMLGLLRTLFGNSATDPALFASVAPAVIESVLAYHASNTQYLSGALTNNLEITTLQGEKIKVVTTTTGEKKLDTGATSDANIVTADIRATNGVVHIVDVVLIPPTIGAQIIQTLGTVAQTILLSSNFTTLAAAIAKADAGKPAAETIAGALIASPAITVFAPVNAVFQGAGITLDTYTAAQWDAIIRGHAVPEALTTLASGTKGTVNGKTITIAAGTNSTVSGSANTSPVAIVAPGVISPNGVVYPIGGVILHN